MGTIGTMSLFRGIAYIILGEGLSGISGKLCFFRPGWWVISFEVVLFAVMAVVFWFLLHRTSFGRGVFVVGNNRSPLRSRVYGWNG